MLVCADGGNLAIFRMCIKVSKKIVVGQPTSSDRVPSAPLPFISTFSPILHKRIPVHEQLQTLEVELIVYLRLSMGPLAVPWFSLSTHTFYT